MLPGSRRCRCLVPADVVVPTVPSSSHPQSSTAGAASSAASSVTCANILLLSTHRPAQAPAPSLGAAFSLLKARARWRLALLTLQHKRAEARGYCLRFVGRFLALLLLLELLRLAGSLRPAGDEAAPTSSAGRSQPPLGATAQAALRGQGGAAAGAQRSALRDPAAVRVRGWAAVPTRAATAGWEAMGGAAATVAIPGERTKAWDASQPHQAGWDASLQRGSGCGALLRRGLEGTACEVAARQQVSKGPGPIVLMAHWRSAASTAHVAHASRFRATSHSEPTGCRLWSPAQTEARR